MKKEKKRSGITALILLLVVVLIAVVLLIVWKQWEYGTSENFYDSLRTSMYLGGARV